MIHNIETYRRSLQATGLRPRGALLGDTRCDQDGNCWTDGVLTSAPLPEPPPAAPLPFGLTSNEWFLIGAIALAGGYVLLNRNAKKNELAALDADYAKRRAAIELKYSPQGHLAAAVRAGKTLVPTVSAGVRRIRKKAS